MAITSTYPIIVPKATDLIVGTQTYTAADPVLDNPTRNFSVQSIVDLAEVDGISLSTVGTSGVSTLTAGVLNIPNYAADPSIVNTTGNQTIGGAKTFTTNISAPNVGGDNTGDQSLSINGQVITISGTNSTVTLPSFSGVTLDTAQTITGIKTFTNAVTITDRLVLRDSLSNGFIGYNSGISNTTGGSNVGIGTNALYSNTTGNNNIGIGTSALYSNTTGTFNIALGQSALFANIGGNGNIALGVSSLGSNTSGGNNISLGSNSLENNTTGNYNLALGYQVLKTNTTGGYNIALGSQGLNNNTTGSSNIALGHVSLFSNTTGTSNIALGISSLQNNTTGSHNVALGNGSLNDNTSGLYNVSLGFASMRSNITGSHNIGLGWRSGQYIADGSENTSGSSSIFIGKDARANGSNQINQIVIGDVAIGNGNNTATLGNDSIVATHLKGDVVLKVDGSGFSKIKTDTTGTIMIGDPAAGVTTGLNVTGDITMQSSTAAINLTSATAAIYMTSPDGTNYKVQMANGGTFNITQV